MVLCFLSQLAPVLLVPLPVAQLGHFEGKGCMLEMGHKDTGFPIETSGPSHDTSTFIKFNNSIGWPDKNRAKLPPLLRKAGVATPTQHPWLIKQFRLPCGV